MVIGDIMESDTLYELYACKLTKFSYDINSGIVNLELFDAESSKSHLLILIGVLSFMFLNDNTSDESTYFSFEDIVNEQINLTLIKNKEIKKNSFKWLNQFKFEFNIIIESFNNAMLFNCKKIEYNGKIINL